MELEEWENTFEDNIIWDIGDGKDIRFWEDKWVDNEEFKVKFPRLFSLTTFKGAKLNQAGSLSNNVWSWNLKWRIFCLIGK